MTTQLTRTLVDDLVSAIPPTEVLDRARQVVGRTIAAAARGTATIHELAAGLDPVDDGAIEVFGGGRWAPGEAAFLLAAASAREHDAQETVDDRLRMAVAGAAIAVGAAEEAPGPAVVEAVAVGVELGDRLEAALGAEHRARGWDPVGTAGPLASALGALRLTRASTAVAEQALGIAATQVAGLRVAAGTPVWGLHAGTAAWAGVRSVALASAGFTGPVAGIEGRRGLFAVIAPHGDPSLVTAALGERWRSAEGGAVVGPTGSGSEDPVTGFLDGRLTWDQLVGAASRRPL